MLREENVYNEVEMGDEDPGLQDPMVEEQNQPIEEI